MTKTLYVSDLDGTLLRSDETISDYTNLVIQELVEKGMIFSYATARSFQTSQKVTKGLKAKIPLIVYNGTMVVDNKDGSFLIKNFFDSDVKSVLIDLITNEIYPIYTGYQWFEMMPKAASKANTIQQLKEMLGCDKVVVFGDGKNDIDMFELADEAYAVENAVEELKEIATAVIGSNNEDGVAKWLKEYGDEA